MLATTQTITTNLAFVVANRSSCFVFCVTFNVVVLCFWILDLVGIGLLGSQFGGGEGKLVAVGVGALAGALIGGQIGKTMDEHDKLMLEKSSHQALEFSPSGSSVQWNNPDSGNHGYITPTKTFREGGQYCREYQQEIVVGGEKHKAFGKACRQADGHWKIIQ